MSLLVIESNDENIRAAVVKKTLKGYKVSNAVKIKRGDEYEIITENEIRAIKLMIENCPERVIIANSSVMLIEVFMDKSKVKAMNKAQLKQAIKWEVEQYVPDNIVGYEICNMSKEDMKKSMEVRIWVSVIPKDDYISLEERFLAEGLKLKNIFPVDTCFPMAKKRGDSKRGMLAVNISERNMKITYFKDKKALKFIEIPIGSEDIIFNIENQTTEEIRNIIVEAFDQMSERDSLFQIRDYGDIKLMSEHANSEDEIVLLSGAGAANKAVVDFIENSVPVYLELVNVDMEEDIVGDDLVVTELASILGAATRQLSLNPGLRTIGINNNPTLLMIIKDNPQMTSVVVVSTVFLVLGVSYLIMGHKIKMNDKEFAELNQLKAEYESLQEESQRIDNQKREVVEDMEVDNEKIVFLSREVDQRRESIVSLLRGVKSSSNMDLKVSYIEPTGSDLKEFIVRGQSDSLFSINNLILGIQAQPWCSYARVLSIGKASPPKKEESEESSDEDVVSAEIKIEPIVTFHTFDMRVVFK